MSAEDFRKKKLFDLMDKAVTINQERDIDTGLLLVRNSSSELVGITDNQDVLVGVITKNRVLDGLSVMGKNKTDKIKEIMYNNPVSIEHDKTVDDALRLMNEKKVDKLPVVDNDGKMIGVISRASLMAKLPSFLSLKL